MIHPDPDYTALYESIAWLLNDIMDDIADLLARGHDGAARDHAGTTRALFDALPDQPDTRTPREKGRAAIQHAITHDNLSPERIAILTAYLQEP
jgi:hypothetical protein